LARQKKPRLLARSEDGGIILIKMTNFSFSKIKVIFSWLRSF